MHKANPLATVHHGFTLRKSVMARNFVYAIGADELEETDSHNAEISNAFSRTKPGAKNTITSFETSFQRNRHTDGLMLHSRRLFLFHCNFRV